MKKLLLFSAFIVFAFFAASLSAMAQLVVYSNAFPGTGGTTTIPGGAPALLYTTTAVSTDASVGSGAGAKLGGTAGSATLTDNMLSQWVSVAPVLGAVNSGYVSSAAPLTYTSPFNPILGDNTELVTWTFNIRMSAPANGYGTGFNGAAVVLAATSPSFRDAGNGYAVIYNPALAQGFQLVHYTGGLTGVVTPFVSTSASLSTFSNYASVRVIYEPPLDQWTIYVRDDGAATFADPSSGVTLSEGSNTDVTYTTVPMTHFGFYSNYNLVYTGAADAQYTYIDNFAATLSCPEISGGSRTCEGRTLPLSHPTPGGTWSSSTPAVATVDAATGLVSGIATGTTMITYITSSCEVYKVVSVNPLPEPPPIVGTATLCAGSITTLTVTPATSGATWTSSNPSVASVHLLSGAVTALSGGTARITYSLPSGCFSLLTMTVNPNAPITGLPILCQGTTEPLASATPGGTWSSSATTIATVDPATGLVSALAVGTSTISYLLPSGCSRSVVVTVNASPTPILGVASICEGGSSTLTSGPAGGFWTSGNETIAVVSEFGTVTGVSAGVVAITYKLESGCQSTIDVTVNPNPGAFSGSFTLCAGATSTLSNAVTGGTWSSSSTAVATVVAATGVVTGVSAGTANITYRLPSGCFRFVNITVNPLPAVITGTASVCEGATTTLVSSAGGTWSSSNPAVGTISTTGVLSGLSIGTTTISYTLGTGCARSLVVTVNAVPPAIGGTLTVCEGTTNVLANSVAGGTWSSSDLAVGTIDATGQLTGIAAGTTTISYTTAAGCFTTAVATVVPTPAAITGPAVICVGLTAAYTNTTTPGFWTTSSTTTASISSSTGVATGVATGTVTITYTSGNGCIATFLATVNSVPGAITGTATVCAGAATTLNASPTGGAWSSSTTAVGTVSATGVVAGIAAGTTTISYTRLGCSSTRVVTVNPLPALIGGATAVCVGATATLTNTSTPGTWSSSNTTVATILSSTGVATGIAAGTSTISYTLGTGCFRTRTLTVNPLPAAIVGSLIICPATSTTLTSATGGGAWSSSAPAVAAVGAGTGVVTGGASGTATITYALPTTCFATAVVTVSPAPPAAITPLGDTVLCPGDFVTLTGFATAGVTYQWVESGTPIPGATALTYTTSTSGSYQIRVLVASGCSNISVPMSVSVNPATATITLPGGATTACAGTPVVMNANTGTGLTYQWELGGVAIPGATASTFNATTAGTYRVRVTNASGCWAVSAPEVITISAVPTAILSAAGPLTVCAGTSVVLSASTGAGYSYQWYNTAGPIPGATAAAYAATTTESYYAEITNLAGCTALTAAAAVVVNPLPNVAITTGGPTIFCSGGNVTLTAVAGFQYQWLRGGSPIPGATNASYLASLSGNYRVRVTNPATACINTTLADTVVTVVASPAAIPLTPATFCWGGSALLSTSYSYLGTAVSYQWYFNSTAIPGATNGTYNADAAGNYTCRITTPAACFEMSSTAPVVELPLPNPVIAQLGTTLRTASNFVSYQWYKNLVPITGATSASVPASGNGSYKVAVTDTNGCQSVSLTYELTNMTGTTATTLAEASNDVPQIFPNPTTGILHIQSATSVRCVVSSIDGRRLIDVANATQVNLSSLADGIYMVSLTDSEGNLLKAERIVKQ